MCARVQELSSERAGATLSEVDEALDLHLGCCPQCSALARALERHGGNKSRTASELGLSRIGLRAKLQRYGIGEAAGDPE